ncbi:MAG: alpha/beta fold hydrolase, partial [Ktedonobacterales bacterium]
MVRDPRHTSAVDSRPIIVFIHGSGDSGRFWSSLIERLPQYTCVALDLPGHGAQLEYPVLDVMSVGDYADAVRALLAERDDYASHTVYEHGVCLVGHSLGSAIALRLAVDHPTLVTHLVLVGAGAR